jgi:hypothetical protein
MGELMKNIIIGFLSFILLTACVSMPSEEEMIKMSEDALSKSHKIKNKYVKGANIYYIVEGTDGISKLVIRKSSSETKNALGTKAKSVSVGFEPLYRIDPNIQECFAGRAQSTIPCEKIKKDKDLAPYITW